jgi:hypothetical protein
MDAGAFVEGSETSWSIGLVLTSRPKPRREYCVPTPSMSGHLSTPLLTVQARRRAGDSGYTPATVLGLQHLAIVGDTHLSRRLGWPFDGKTDGGWNGWCLPAA